MSRGFTLVEVIVVLTVLSIALSTAALSFPAAGRGTAADSAAAVLEAARVRALHSGQAVKAGNATDPVLFLPDGRAIGAGFDPLSGAPVDSAR